MHPLRLSLVALQLAGGAALLLHGAARPPLERRAGAVVCGLFEAMGDAIAKDPLGMLKNNLQQMSDQRVAQEHT